jgi:hypothetical protein
VTQKWKDPELGTPGLNDKRPSPASLDQISSNPQKTARPAQRYEVHLGYPGLLWDNFFRCWTARDINGDPMPQGWPPSKGAAMIAALVSGTLSKRAESRQSKGGKAFVTGTIRSNDGDSSQFVRFVGFPENARAELLRLREGDAVSVQGALKCELYRPEGGEPKLSLSIFVDQVIALRAAPLPTATSSSSSNRI